MKKKKILKKKKLLKKIMIMKLKQKIMQRIFLNGG